MGSVQFSRLIFSFSRSSLAFPFLKLFFHRGVNTSRPYLEVFFYIAARTFSQMEKHPFKDNV